MEEREGQRRYEAALASLAKYTAGFDLDGVPLMSGKEIVTARETRRVILIDVRNEAEQRVSMIPGAVTTDEFEDMRRNGAESLADAIIVPYCTIGYRSGHYASALKKANPSFDVRNGTGVVLWSHEVGTFERRMADGTVEPVDELHVYGSAWDLAPPGMRTITYGTAAYVHETARFLWSLLFGLGRSSR